MDMQQMFDMLSDASRRTRGEYHLTLGKLIAALEASSPTATVIFTDGSYPGSESSYRGYYEDLAFGRSNTPKLAFDLLTQARGALNATYEGYKGGGYVMRNGTPLWAADYGDCGEAIVSMRCEADRITLVTKEID